MSAASSSEAVSPRGSLEDPEAGSSKQDSPDFSSYWRIFSFTDRVGWILNGIALVAAIASGTLLPLMNLIFGKAVSSFTNFGSGGISANEFRSQATKWSLWFIYLFIARFFLTYIWTVTLNISALRTVKAMRSAFLKQSLRQDIAFYDQSTQSAIAVQVVTNGNLVNVGIAEKLGLVVQGLATFLAAFVVAFSVQWKLTLITLSIVPAMLTILAICIAAAVKTEAKTLNYYARAGAYAEDVFSSIRAVHAFGAQKPLSDKYNDLLLAAKREGLKLKLVFGGLFSDQFFCVTAGYSLAFWQGFHMYASGEISNSGTVVTVVFAVILAATSLNQVAPQFITVTKAASAAHDLFKIIDRQPEIDSMSTAGERPAELKGDIEVRDVVFRYPSRGKTDVLRGLSLQLQKGKTTALVGPSGSGKSTVVGLLERWYDPIEGSISVDGHDIRNLNLQWLRTNIRVVQQEPVLFNATVFENVAFGLIGTVNADAPREVQMKLVQQACKETFAHEFVAQLPQGYDTPIGERGGKLSGGQKQRIAIARSIISDPKVLLLDEATSALDPNAERVVQEALDNVSAKRTTLIIAHRLSTVRKADVIAVMANGAIVEHGTHNDLMSQQGMYADLVHAQGLNQMHADEPHVDTKETVESELDLATSKEASVNGRDEAVDTKGFNYSLFTCLIKLAKQQPHLYPWFALVCFISVLGGGIQPCTAVLFARAINVFQLDKSEVVSKGNFWALMLFVLALAVGMTYFTEGWSANIISQETTHFYRLQLYDDIIRQDIDFFDEESNTSGALVSRLSSLPTDLEELIGFNLSLLILITSTILASSILAIATGWKLGLTISLSALPVMVSFGYIRIRLESKLEAEAGDKFASSAALASEAISAIRTISSLAMEASVLDRYESRLENIVAESIRGYLWTMIWFSLSQSVNFLAMALGFWYGSRLLSTGEYDTTQFFTVFVCVIFSGEGTAQFFSYTTSFTKAQKAANYLLWLHSVEPKMLPRKSLLALKESWAEDNGGASVDFQNVCFAYPRVSQQQVIKDVSLTVESGQNVAFVGASGCGKTTLLALLERFYDPTSGVISFQSQLIHKMDIRTYRSHIAMVQQEPTLYSGIIRDNISLGRAIKSSDLADVASADIDGEVEDACRKAQIWEFISSLPEGLNTAVGSRGAQLSGGQRQRIALARALIRKPALLLLDEATSALDTTTERAVQAAMSSSTGPDEKSRKDHCTTIAVAHRLSTIKHCDRIYVFDQGRCVESGTHSELLVEQGYYFRLCQGQSLD